MALEDTACRALKARDRTQVDLWQTQMELESTRISAVLHFCSNVANNRYNRE
jgi:hypothetical protein